MTAFFHQSAELDSLVLSAGVAAAAVLIVAGAASVRASTIAQPARLRSKGLVQCIAVSSLLCPLLVISSAVEKRFCKNGCNQPKYHMPGGFGASHLPPSGAGWFESEPDGPAVSKPVHLTSGSRLLRSSVQRGRSARSASGCEAMATSGWRKKSASAEMSTQSAWNS